MDIHIRRIRGTPYKIVLGACHEILGAFDHGNYVSREHMNDKLRHVIGQFHAEVFSEEVEEVAHGSS